MDTCPVCGMEIEGDRPEASLRYQVVDYNFCSKECRDEFQRNPQKYATEAAA